MTKAMKNTLVSVLVMAVIAVVSVGILAVANAYFPEYEAKLDKKTANLINTICPTGVDGQTAMDDGWFVMATVDKEQLVALNAEHGVDKSNKVLAVYDVMKGDCQGYRVVESQAQGYSGNPLLIVLTAFDKDGKIADKDGKARLVVKQQKENPMGNKNVFVGEYFDAFLTYAAGKTQIGGVDEINAATGATNKYTVKGLSNAVNVACKVVASLYGGNAA